MVYFGGADPWKLNRVSIAYRDDDEVGMRKQTKEFVPLLFGAFGIGLLFFKLTLPAPEPKRLSVRRKEVQIVYATTIPTTTELYNDKLVEIKANGGRIGIDHCKTPKTLAQWEVPYVPRRLRVARWDDEDLIEHIRRCWIFPPVGGSRSVSAKNGSAPSDQWRVVDKALRQKTNGFFVECGATDGVTFSDTLHFERSRNWTGLLVEAEPTAFADLLRNKRDSFVTNACLSPSDHAAVLEFARVNDTTLSGLIDHLRVNDRDKRSEIRNIIAVQCFPLASMLRAINVSRVDYLSLDVEGSELDILDSLPYDTVSFNAFTVNFRVMGSKNATENKRTQIRKLMVKGRGYREVATTSNLNIILAKP
ncbi:hypothetical protein LSH36_255g03008 [Paralvinella palmiformis]|uniref:Methyltransferase FkbM domain-containing protein n=1 Tax=Paralvinella palmiformis TaxID=53620 RepID=A0AAD9JKQ1_9ANNE|nr:hypothetical protein LSH36_255g03008 [Paralvinella palmiformis]